MKARSKILVLLLTLALLCGILFVSASAADATLTKLTTLKGTALTGEKNYGVSVSTVGLEGTERNNYYTLDGTSDQSQSHGTSVYYYWHKESGYSYLTMDVDFTTESYYPSDSGVDFYFLNRDSGNKWLAQQLGITITQVSSSSPIATLRTVPRANSGAVEFDATPFVWHHVTVVIKISADHAETTPYAVTQDHSEMKVFLDGKLVKTIGADADGTTLLNAKQYQLEALRVQPRTKTPGSTLCYDNLNANRYAVGDGTDLDKLFAEDATADDLDLTKTTYASLNYKAAPTTKKAAASVGNAYYATLEEALEVAGEEDTVTLYADATDVRITKNCTVNAQNYTFTYVASGYDVATDETGKIYTFKRASRVATVLYLDQNGDQISSEIYGVGAVPSLPEIEKEYRKEDGTFLYFAAFSASMDGTALSDFTVITEDMLDKTITLAPVYKQAAFVVKSGSTTTYHEIKDTEEDNSALFVTLMNALVTGECLRMETDVTLAAPPAAMEMRSVALDLNGHTLTYGGGTQLFSAKNSTFHLVSSRSGAKIISTTKTPCLINPYSGSRVFVGAGEAGTDYGDFDGDNISYYDIGIVTMQSNNLCVTGGYFYHSGSTPMVQYPGSGNVRLTNVKIYFSETYTSALIRTSSEQATYNPTITMTGCTVYSAGERAYFCSIAKELASFAINIEDCDIFGLRVEAIGNYPSKVNWTVDEASRFTYLSSSANRNDLVAAGVPAETVTLNGFYAADGTALPVSATYAFAMVDKTTALPVAWTVNGTVVLTDYWTVGATPFFAGGSLTIPYVQDPDKDENVFVPSGVWQIGGAALAPVTAEQLAAGTTLTATPELVSAKKAFQITDADGNITYSVDTEYATFRTALLNLKANAKVKMYTDYLDIPLGQHLKITANGAELDLNGHKLKTIWKHESERGMIVTTSTVYIYSSAPDAQILADEPYVVSAKKGGGFIFNVSSGTLILGRTADGTTYDRSYLTARGTCLVRIVSAAEFDNITYVNTEGDNWGYIQFDGKNAKVTIKDSDLWLTDTRTNNMKSLFGISGGEGGWSATVSGSRIYIAGNIQLTGYRSTMAGKNPPGATITDTMICSAIPLVYDANFPIKIGKGVKTNQPNNFTLVTSEEETLVFAHTDATKATLNENDFSLLYEVVAVADAFTATFKTGSTTVEETWKKDSKPTYRANVFGSNKESTYYWYAAATAGITADSEYPAKLKTTESKITGNLTLYANITFNLYFKNDGFIKGVKYNNISHYFTEADEKNGYYYFPISDISPKDLSEAFTLEVILENGETAATYTVNTSLSKYAASVLASDESAEGKNLVMALLDYVYEMSIDPDLGGKDPTNSEEKGLQAIRKGLDYYKQSLNYEREEWDGTAPTPVKGNITDAALRLASTPGFIFYLDSTKYATAETVEVTINGVTKSYDVTHAEGNNHYIIVDDIHVSKYNDTMTVELDGTSFNYSLGAYMKGYETIPEYAKALYNYVCAAKAYLVAQGN